jgi:hypothetical protein
MRSQPGQAKDHREAGQVAPRAVTLWLAVVAVGPFVVAFVVLVPLYLVVGNDGLAALELVATVIGLLVP